MSWKENMNARDKRYFKKYFNREKKLYDLVFNDEILVQRQPYPVCQARKNKEIASGTYNGVKHLLIIKPSINQ